MPTRQWAREALRGCARGRHVVLTPSLHFRSLTVADVRVAAAAGSDPAAQRWLGWHPADLVPEDERDRLLAAPPGRGGARFGLPGRRVWTSMLAIDPERGLAAGMVTLTPRSEKACELGGHLAPAYRGRGLGAELFTAGLALAHRHLGFAEVRAGAEPENAASVRSLWRAGLDPAAGPDTYRLADGRVIRPSWFAGVEPNPARCPSGR
ncbi:GNAT family N-acetyltransferase [Actinomadura monticuli]|uniref:GNAT family N-acetyltransferase n=1 Tax=Actinomadura monticuli TaxID=3097367 RepID=A0ABV4QL11_9ACTN